MINQQHSTVGHWTLTEYGQGSTQRRTFNVPMPQCVVGRGNHVGFRVDDPSVSKRHARLFLEGDGLYVEDLGSTNGTFVNGNPTKHSVLSPGDLLQFANALYRVGCDEGSYGDGTQEHGPSAWAHTLILFDQLLTDRMVLPHFQSIVAMETQEPLSFEILARSNLSGLRNPAAMFGAAERLGQQAALSELMREEGARIATESAHRDCGFFFNIHPVEFGTDRLDHSLRALRQHFPELTITIEIHEGAVSELDMMRRFRDLLASLEMDLAYDDFGAGQGRLVELTEVPPKVLKFDMQLIRDIDQAPKTRQDLLRSLVQIAIDSGSIPLAEGVETEAEHQVCKELGFELGQGYFYGRPATF
ncbi:MAG: EAL domain-containing protein [Planctomycetales bacterium]|nr:EAL domain-containing protein [Planctomycetales bacterium]